MKMYATETKWVITDSTAMFKAIQSSEMKPLAGSFWLLGYIWGSDWE